MTKSFSPFFMIAHMGQTYHFIADDQQVVLGRQSSNLLQLFAREHLSDRGVWGVENNYLGAGRDLGLQFLDINLPFACSHVLRDVSLGPNGAVNWNSSVHGNVGL